MYSAHSWIIQNSIRRHNSGIIFLYQCGSSSNPNSPSTPEIETPIENPSFAQHIQTIFNTSCAVSGCHNNTAKAGLNLSQGVASFAILCIPSYASNSNYEKPNTENTFALGLGGRLTFIDNLSLIAEWIPVLSGYKDKSTGWGAGLEWKIGGHVFQIFALNSFGLPTAQYLPGGDLRLSENDFRFGFSIFRLF